MLEIPAPAAPWVVLGLVLAIFVAFVRERHPPDVVVVIAVGVLLATGLLPTSDFLAAFSNSAPVTIAAMFVLSGALLRTGAIEAFGTAIARLAQRRPAIALGAVLFAVIVASAFINNTPVVIVLIPVIMQLARKLGRSPSRFLMPLSYATILGGSCTLIGTSTNLLVDGVAQRAGLAPFGMFEITGAGAVMGVIGLVWLLLVGQRMLPERETVGSLLDDAPRPHFLTEVMIPHDSPLVGRKVADVRLFHRADGRVIDVLRGEESLRRQMAELVLAAGDRVVLKTNVGEVMSLRESGRLALPEEEAEAAAVEPIGSRQAVVVEGLVGPKSPLVGQRLGDTRLRRRYGVYPLAVHRRSENLGRNLDAVVLKPGDTLLMEGAAEDVRRCSDREGLINLSEPSERPLRRRKAPLVMLVIAAIMGLAAFEVMNIAALAVIGVAVVLATRCIEADEAWQSVDWRILIIILGMLGVGRAMESTGAMALIIDAVAPHLRDLPPLVVLAVVYALTSLLTEIVTNNAVAVLMTPLVIGLAATLGVDPRPFVVAVMFAASASFATPIGYQTNTMVYSAGGYRFTDFLVVGLPMNIVIGVAAVLLIPLFWPL